ncbi:hypothetical protein B0H16DRAFT_1446935 [Mycena metata]|uniref:SET domain-containing protein n=1 Tax=Mycena metata TaxID=1033252 RepID=A0AAD7KCP4_9AGAR|nr:hypothetical protein B0H16DRAFT_1446935 [Mycena metata]
MKRGFLNSSKAHSKMASVGRPDVHQVLPGVPEGYKTPKVNIKEGDPTIDPKTLPQGAFLFTSLPNIPLDEHDPDNWTSCLLQVATKAQIVDTPGFPRPLLHPPKPRYHIGPTPNMGLAAFSSCALKMGDLILSERALLIAPAHLFAEDNFPEDFTDAQLHQAVFAQAEARLQVAYDRMLPENQKAYMALANSHLQDGSGPILGVMRTNGVNAAPLTRPGDPPMPYSATCKEISRLNHSCSPNTAAEFDMPSFSFRLFAIRDIAAGEELTYTYTDTSASAAVRQKILEPYGFRCTCRACLDPRLSDARRASIHRASPTPALMSMWAEEGLQASPLYGQHAVTLMERYIGAGDLENAMVYARMCSKMKWFGCGAEDWADPAKIKADPQWRKDVK